MDSNQNGCCWRGTPMEEIYRGLSEWELSHLPPILNRRNHTVLFELPIDLNSTIPPKPHAGHMKWDSLHVRLPCSPQNEYIVTDEVCTFYTGPLWTVKMFSTFLWHLTERWKFDGEKATLGNHTKRIAATDSDQSWLGEGNSIIQYQICQTMEILRFAWIVRRGRGVEILNCLHSFWNSSKLYFQDLDAAESTAFFAETLPEIIRLALRLPDLIPSAIPLLKHSISKSVSLSQEQVASLLANAFLVSLLSIVFEPRINESIFAVHISPSQRIQSKIRIS